ncbi:hypothetical protein VU04_01170 [Desulfobulbus sp. TB]|nr:hypothetical protein [Desulfobulbus sp. TB]
MKKSFGTFLGVITAAVLTTGFAASAAVNDEYTTLLIQSETFDGDTQVFDSSPSNHVVESYGNVFHRIEEAKFGDTSLLLDGSGAYLKLQDSEDWNFADQDFTIDFWVNTTGRSRTMFFTQGWGVRHAETIQSVLLDYLPSNQLILGYKGRTPHNNRKYSPPAINDGNWHHIAVVRHNNILKAYCDGKETNSIDMSGDPIVNDSPLPFLIGKYSRDANTAYWDGYLEEFRISKGIARWTGEFTPPNSPDVEEEPQDSDNDGIIDEQDSCPNTPNGSTVDADGCPEPCDELTQLLTQKEQTISALNSTVSDLNTTITQKDQAIDDLNTTVAEKEQTINELNSTVNDLNTTVAQKDQAIDDLNTTVAEKEQAISILNSTVNDLNAVIAQKNQVIESLNATIAAMFTQAELEQAAATAEAQGAKSVVSNLEEQLQNIFNDADFAIAGLTVEEQITNLINAVSNLPNGQRKHLKEDMQP